jgi:hypothetical protein
MTGEEIRTVKLLAAMETGGSMSALVRKLLEERVRRVAAQKVSR